MPGFRLVRVAPLLMCAFTVFTAWAQTKSETIAHLPLAFERQGETPGERVTARGQDYVLGLEGGKATIEVVAKDQTCHAISLEFAGSRPSEAVPGGELPGKVNYIRGNDPRKWRIGVPTYSRVTYADVYPGIDVVYYGDQQQLEFDLLVKPGADPGAIRMKIDGGKISLDGSGELKIGGNGGVDFGIALPKIYQEFDGTRRAISGHYELRGEDEVAFGMESYDRSRPLVIDPTIVYSTLLGGGLGSTYGEAVAVDSSGNILVAGQTYAEDFPTLDAQQGSLAGAANVFVTKINAAGTALVYSTYLGGSGADVAYGLAVDSAGSAWVTGATYSSDFPILNAAQPSDNGNKYAFVAKLDAAGSLGFSTFLGSVSYNASASACGRAVAVDSSGNGYVTGYSAGPFPTTTGVFQSTNQGGNDAFVTKYSPVGAVVYSTLLGGAGYDEGYGIAVDSTGAAYVTGYSDSSSFPGAPAGGAQTANAGGGDVFVAKLNRNASALSYFTFLGGAGLEQANAIAVDSAGNAYIAGQTSSTGLATAGAAQTNLAGAQNGIVAKLNASGSAFTYVTYLGGTRIDALTGLAVDGSGNVYVAGYSDSVNFPTAAAVEPAFPGNGISVFQSADSGSTFSAFDSNIPGATYQVSINPASNSAVALTESGIYRTTDGGASWALRYTPTLEFPFNSSSSLARSPVAPGTLYASIGCDGGIVLSTDDGATWIRAGSLFPTCYYLQSPLLLADPLSATTVYAAPSGISNSTIDIYRSTDGGTSWIPFDPGVASYSVSAIGATSDGSLYAVFPGYGVYKSTNQASSWTVVSSGPAGSGSYLSASGTTLYVIAGGVIYKSSDAGTSWTALSGLSNAFRVAASPQNPSVVYAITLTQVNSASTVAVSSDGGATWNVSGTGLPWNVFTINIGLVVDPSNSAHVLVLPWTVNESAVVAKLNAAGSTLIWSTYLGGTTPTYAEAVATDSAGDAFVTGYKNGSGIFPVTSAALPSSPPLFESIFDFIGFVTKISDATAVCSAPSVTPESALAPQGGGTLTFTVVVPSGCNWTASTNASWAVISSGASGTGTGIVMVQIAPNQTAATQSAVVTIGSQNITITQPGNSCTYSVDSTSYSVTQAGGPVSVILSAAAGCPWTVTNPYPNAISVTSASSGTGSSMIGLMVSPSSYAGSNNFTLSAGTAQINISQTALALTIGITSLGAGGAGASYSGALSAIGGTPPYSNWTVFSGSLPPGLALNPMTGAITGTVAATAGGVYSFTVTVQDTVSKASANLSISIAPGPVIISVDPNAAPSGSNAIPVTIAGTNLGLITGVIFTPLGGSATTIVPTAVAATQVIATIPAGSLTSAGTAQIAVQNSFGTLSNQVAFSISTGPAPQTIIFEAIPNYPLGSMPFQIAARASSGIAVSLVSNTPLVCTVSGNTATLVATGFCSITASQAGNGSYVTAASVTRSFDVTAAVAPSGTLVPGSDTPAAAEARGGSLVAGDFNGDGIQDLAVAVSGPNGIAVLLGTGSGTFTAAPGSPFAMETAPYAIAVGDFNGDGIQDLATVDNYSNNVTVLLGNGSGGFTAASGSPFPAGSVPGPVAVADFNGDGIQDLAVPNFGTDSVTVLFGDGSGGFTVSASFAAGSGPLSVAVGDFNGDGIPDLVAANTNSSALTVLLGDGTGGFEAAPASPVPVPGSPRLMAVGDFNGDGVQDLAVADAFDGVTVLLGNGAGGFMATAGSPFYTGVGAVPCSILAGDLNGDGHLDLAVGNLGTNRIFVLLGQGSGSFFPKGFGLTTDINAGPCVAAGDFNGDGRLDLADSDIEGIGVTLLLGASAPTSPLLSTTLSPTSPFTIAAGTAVPLLVNVSQQPLTAFNGETGTVTFLDGTTTLGTASQTSNSYTFVASNLGLGSHTLTATYSGDARNLGSTSNSITIQVALAQTITFGPLSDEPLGTAPFALTATASSGIAVTYASNTPTVCTVSGNTVTILISGGCSLTATQAGNATYAPAVPVTQDFTVLFNDISPSAPYAAAVDLFAQYGITAGCGNDDFCANGLVTRAEMAVFIITGIFRGADFSYSTTPHFADVQPGAFGFKWIQAMYELGITAGCGGGNYCPNGPVTRDDMAVFIIVARFGTGASFSYSSTPSFADVPDTGATAPYFKFVQRMKQDGITAGCAKAVAPATLPTYCPDESVTRAQMAVFMMAGLFNYPLPAEAPAITAISPSTLGAGTSGTFTITGVNTSFVQGTTTLSPIPGVTIGMITVNSPTSLNVQLTAAENAAAQPGSIVAITGSEQDVLPNGLVIQ